MSGYGYTFRGSYNGNGLEPKSSDWSKTSYEANHACRPVIVDAEGRKRPFIPYTAHHNVEGYVTKTEVIEHVVMPVVAEYPHNGAATKLEPWKNYGVAVAENKWGRPSSPVKDHGSKEDKWYRPSSPKKDYGYVEDKRRSPSSPVKSYGAAEDQWRRPSSPVRSYGVTEDKWRKPSSPDKDRPKEVEDFITKVQTEASRPNRYAPVRATNWRQTPNSGGYYRNNNGYGDYNDFGNKEWQKPSGNETYNDYYYPKTENGMEPNPIITTGGWARPSRTTWSAPPRGSLSNPTSDIGTAMEMLKEAAAPSPVSTAPGSRYLVPIASGPNTGASSETIDSREAARRYGNFKLGSRPVDNYSTTIDSRAAARKYGGVKL